jgi:hypothetical protein
MVLGFVGVDGRHGKSNLKRRHPTTNAVIWDFFPCLTIFIIVQCSYYHFFNTVLQILGFQATVGIQANKASATSMRKRLLTMEKQIPWVWNKG